MEAGTRAGLFSGGCRERILPVPATREHGVHAASMFEDLWVANSLETPVARKVKRRERSAPVSWGRCGCQQLVRQRRPTKSSITVIFSHTEWFPLPANGGTGRGLPVGRAIPSLPC